MALAYAKDVYRSFSSDVTAAILVYQNNEMAAILVYGTGIHGSFLFKYFVLFHHPTGATDHVSENDLLKLGKVLITEYLSLNESEGSRVCFVNPRPPLLPEAKPRSQ
jgi:hypothetical protein